jgi:hypothetical protein
MHIPKSLRFARVMTGFFLVLSIQLLIYVFYRSEVVLHGLENDIYLKYYLVSVFGILFWILVFRSRDEIKLNVVMVTISLVTGIYMVEFYFHFFHSVDVDHSVSVERRSAAAKAVGVKFNTQTKRTVYLSMKQEGLDVVPSIHPSEEFVKTNGVPGEEPLYPMAGISEKTTIYCNENGEYSIFLSDRYGFNNPNLEWDSEQTEWMLTGDSFAQGACVNPGEEIAGQIRLITRESLINLGIGGNGLLSELASLKEYAESRKPKKVIWLYYEGNDLLDTKKERSASLLMNYLKPNFSQNLIDRQDEIDKRLSKYISKAEIDSDRPYVRPYYVKFIKALRLINIRQRIGFDLTVGPLFNEVVRQARDRIAGWGGELFFVYLPHHTRYKARIQGHDRYMKRGLIIDTVKNLGIPVIDIHQKVFEKHPAPLSLFPFQQYGHYTAAANTEIAKAIILSVSKYDLPPKN